MTEGIFLFQAIIVISMLGVARRGRLWLRAIGVLWVLFTLLGAIVTYGLMLGQLLTISVAYNIGLHLVPRTHNVDSAAGKVPVPIPVDSPRSRQGLTFLCIACLMGGLWWASSRPALTGGVAVPTSVYAAPSTPVVPPTLAPIQRGQPSHHARRRGDKPSVARQETLDASAMRWKCMSVKTAEEFHDCSVLRGSDPTEVRHE